ATILGTGEVCMVLNPLDLMRSAQRREVSPVIARNAPAVDRKRVVLLAEDSITTRTQEKRILESDGYDVVTAVDGLDALGKLGSRQFDAVVSDIQMPNLNGLELTARIRQDARYREVPIILVTTAVGPEDSERVFELLQAGAIDVFPKPRGGLISNGPFAEQLVSKIKVVAGVFVFPRRPRTAVLTPLPTARPTATTPRII